MQFTWLAIKSHAVIIEDAIGDIAALLNLCEEDASADGMYPACRDIEHITGLNLMFSKVVYDSAIGYFLLILFGCKRLSEA